MAAPARTQVFISYSHADAEWLTRIQIMLRPLTRNQTITVWDDTRIQAGSKWREEIEGALASVKVAVLLVSPNFLASEFIANDELPPLLKASAEGGLTVLWVAVSSSFYEVTDIAEYQAANNPATPLDSLSPSALNAELVKIARQIRDAATRAISPKPEDASASGIAMRGHGYGNSIGPSSAPEWSSSSPVNTAPQIFLCHVRQDEATVRELYQRLSAAGFRPWMDQENIYPGEQWQASIERAIEQSDFFLACLSPHAVSRRGFLQRELKTALDRWQEKLHSAIYLIPARLEPCSGASFRTSSRT